MKFNALAGTILATFVLSATIATAKPVGEESKPKSTKTTLETETEAIEPETNSYADATVFLRDSETGEPLEEGRMQILSEDGEIILFEFETYDSGYVVKGLKNGTYLLRTTFAPKGYLPTEDLTFEHSGKNPTTISAVATKTKAEAEIESEFEIETETEVETEIETETETNAKYGLIVAILENEDGNMLTEASAEANVLDEDGKVVRKAVFRNGRYQGEFPYGTYELEFTIPPDGMTAGNEAEVRSDEKSADEEIPIRFERKRFEFRTTDEDGKGLKCKKCFLVDENGSKVLDWIPTGETSVVAGLKSGTYEWNVVPPNGYATPAPKAIEIGDDDEKDAFSTEVKRTRLNVSVADSKGNPVEDGTSVSMKNDRGTEVDAWKCDGKPHEIVGFETGSYRFELTVPSDKATPVPHYVDLKDSEEEQEFVIEVDGTKTRFRRYGENEKSIVGNCEISVVDEDGKKVLSFETKRNVETTISGIPSGKYVAEETRTADGRTPAESVEFEVSSASGETAVELRPEKTPVPEETTTGTEIPNLEPEESGNVRAIVAIVAGIVALAALAVLLVVFRKKDGIENGNATESEQKGDASDENEPKDEN